MPSQATSQGIAIPTEQIRSALESVAIPGYTGTLQLEIGLSEAAAQCVMIGVIRRQSLRPDGPAATRQQLPDPQRKKPVERVMEDIKTRLFVRPVLTAVEAHYLDGVLQKFTVQE